MKRYRFDPAARAEYVAAIAWYADRAEIAGDFIEAVELAIKNIRKTPNAFARAPGPADEDVRRHLVRRFPYAIFYLVERGHVAIVAVAHTSRRPNYWVDRLRR